MLRQTLAAMSRVGNTMFRRATLRKADDSKLMQSVDLDGVAGERKMKVERFQQYGFTSVPLPQKDDKTNEVAEVILMYMGGSGGHPVVLAVDDRRHRLKNMKPGEAAMFDDQWQMVRLTRNGIVVSSPFSVTHEVATPNQDRDPSKTFGQDADAARTAKTRIVQTKNSIRVEYGATFIELSDQGIKLSTDGDKSIVSHVDNGVIKAEGNTTNWKGPKED